MEWMEMEDMPTPRSHLSGALQPRSPYIYAVGGNDGSGETNDEKSSGRLKSVIRFNMETNHWEPWGEMLQVRRCVHNHSDSHTRTARARTHTDTHISCCLVLPRR